MVGCLVLAAEFAFHLEEIDPSPGRHAWIMELGRIGNGAVGILIWLVFGSIFAWWTVRALWRALTLLPALSVKDDILELHASYRAGRIPMRAIAKLAVRQEVRARMLGIVPPIHKLEIVLKQRGLLGAKKIKLRSNTIEGGLPALERFNSELELFWSSREQDGLTSKLPD